MINFNNNKNNLLNIIENNFSIFSDYDKSHNDINLSKINLILIEAKNDKTNECVQKS